MQCKRRNWELPYVPTDAEVPTGFWKRYFVERFRLNSKRTYFLSLTPTGSQSLSSMNIPSLNAAAGTYAPARPIRSNESGERVRKLSLNRSQTLARKHAWSTSSCEKANKTPLKESKQIENWDGKSENVLPTKVFKRTHVTPENSHTGYQTAASGPCYLYTRQRHPKATQVKKPVECGPKWLPFSNGQSGSLNECERTKRILWLNQVRQRYSFKELQRRARTELGWTFETAPRLHRRSLYSPLDRNAKCYAEVFANPCSAGTRSPIPDLAWPTMTEKGCVELSKESRNAQESSILICRGDDEHQPFSPSNDEEEFRSESLMKTEIPDEQLLTPNKSGKLPGIVIEGSAESCLGEEQCESAKSCYHDIFPEVALCTLVKCWEREKSFMWLPKLGEPITCSFVAIPSATNSRVFCPIRP